MIQNTIITTSETIIYQTGVSETFAILTILFCNTSANQVVFTAYAYPSGSSAGDGTTFIKELALNAGETYVWSANEKFILDPEDTVSAITTSGAITATVNGLSI